MVLASDAITLHSIGIRLLDIAPSITSHPITSKSELYAICDDTEDSPVGISIIT